jgi:FixJ family two-component response regulator
VILLSGVMDLPLVAAEVGTPYYLAKPYRIDALLALVERALVERRAPRPRRA